MFSKLRVPKLEFVIILLVLLSLSHVGHARFGGNIANKYFLDKEKFIFEILHRVGEPRMNREWHGIGKDLVLNETNYLFFNSEMGEFSKSFWKGTLLPRDHIFNPFEPSQYRQSLGLFYFFYNAKNWETLRTNACWARKYVNPEMFVFTFSQALLKRIDLKGLILPKIHEILPNYFISERDLHIAEKFDYDQWSYWEGYYGSALSQPKISSSLTNVFLPRAIKNLRGTAKWAQAMENVTALWFSEQSKKLEAKSLNSLTHDLDWNTFWYYQNMGLWWSDIDTSNGKFSKWELWFGNLQKILARYKLETYAMAYRDKVQSKQVSESMEPGLTLRQGLKLRASHSAESMRVLDGLDVLNARVDQIINEKRVVLASTGKVLTSLDQRPNWHALLNELFGRNLYEFWRKYFGLSNEPMKAPFPQLLQYFETQLRDPRFFIYAEILLKAYQRLYRTFQPNDVTQLKQPHVKIVDVSLTQRMETFYEDLDIDASNLLSNKHYYFEGQLIWEKSLQIRQRNRLQHRPFALQFNITSAMPQAIVLRTFLTTVSAPMATPNSYFQLDSFFVNLIAGTNIVERKSDDFFDAQSKNHLSYTELYRYTLLALNDRFDFPLNISNSNCAFPQRLMLPRGGLHGDGLSVKFFFIATAYEYGFHAAANYDCDFTDGITRFDDLPLNFPFEYEHDEAGAFNGEHIHWKRAEIFHLD